MILLFYYFDYVVGPKETNWWAKWTKKGCCWEELWKGEVWAQRITLPCKPYSSHAKPKETMSWLASRDFLFLMPWDDKLSHGLTQAVRPSREALGCHSAFHKETKTRDFSPSLYKKNIIFGARTRRKREEKEAEGKESKKQGLSRSLGINSTRFQC